MNRTEKLEVATVLKRKSEEVRTLGLSQPAGEQRAHNLHTQLYHAATAFQLWSDSHKSGDFDLMQEFTNNLELAADAFAQR